MEERRENGQMMTDGIIPPPTNPMVNPLLTDLYQYTMAYAYWKAGKHNERAVFDLFFRRSPFGGEYTVFAGLEECIRFIANFKFTAQDIDFLRGALSGGCEVSDGWPLGEGSHLAWRQYNYAACTFEWLESIAYAKCFMELYHCITARHKTFGIGQVFCP